jgi:hypothetical protein
MNDDQRVVTVISPSGEENVVVNPEFAASTVQRLQMVVDEVERREPTAEEQIAVLLQMNQEMRNAITKSIPPELEIIGRMSKEQALAVQEFYKAKKTKTKLDRERFKVITNWFLPAVVAGGGTYALSRVTKIGPYIAQSMSDFSRGGWLRCMVVHQDIKETTGWLGGKQQSLGPEYNITNEDLSWISSQICSGLGYLNSPLDLFASWVRESETAILVVFMFLLYILMFYGSRLKSISWSGIKFGFSSRSRRAPRRSVRKSVRRSRRAPRKSVRRSRRAPRRSVRRSRRAPRRSVRRSRRAPRKSVRRSRRAPRRSVRRSRRAPRRSVRTSRRAPRRSARKSRRAPRRSARKSRRA